MLYAFGFSRVGVVVGDLYFLDPDPPPGQEGAERGVRLEVRLLDVAEAPGSIYASRPITIGTPIWRADLLERVEGRPGSLDRAHHHPSFSGWEPGDRKFERSMHADPIAFVGTQLGDLGALLDAAGVKPEEVAPDDAASLAAAVPEICETVRRLLARVHAGELALAPSGQEDATNIRASWL